MRIAILSTAVPVPPGNYGGTEWVVYNLVQGLSSRGHQVTLFTSNASTIDFPGVTKVPIQISWEYDDYLGKLLIEEISNGNFDIVHDHSNDGIISPLRWDKRNYLCTIHGADHKDQANRVYLSRKHRENSHDPTAPFVYNGLNGDAIPFSTTKKNYLLWIGRLDWQKVPHTAIDIAENLGEPLILAGPVCDHPYFAKYIQPHLSEKIRYVGAIGLPLRHNLYADAKALLFTSNWREPFGLTMIESMFAGTPVIAQDNGSNAVSEIVKDGVSGFVCHSVEDMKYAVQKLHTLNYASVRQHVDSMFRQEHMVEAYLSLYDKLLRKEVLCGVNGNRY